MATIVETSQWTKSQIAALNDSELARLTYDQMVDVVLVSGVQERDIQWVRSLEADVLVRLVHWSRRSCRGQTT
jgi:hypothetical protein